VKYNIFCGYYHPNLGNIDEILKNYGDHKVGMVRDKVRELAIFMENYELLRKEKEMIRDEVYRLVETITTKYNEEVGDIGEIDPITKVGLGKEILTHISHDMIQEMVIE
jgi:hypothetical protein